MKTDADRMPILLHRTRLGLEARSREARDVLEKYALGAVVEVTLRKRRSSTQNALYWAMLQRVVDATGAYPTAPHLHDALKLELGYTTPMKTLSGEIRYIPDSTAFGKMDAALFRTFFDAATAKLAEIYGFDPVEQVAA